MPDERGPACLLVGAQHAAPGQVRLRVAELRVAQALQADHLGGADRAGRPLWMNAAAGCGRGSKHRGNKAELS
ncbi:hypothetical protein [Micromonospora sp. b486]|uniref:hypothetical protein n=1 Tax=Micromonospora sp. b486 TaxID=3053986 RepID=UPI00259CE552|nr:hypothetical protein [Micromonospora sp. b486]MDM4777822.1 hypothetical protein [Micromonospora sp. b486]